MALLLKTRFLGSDGWKRHCSINILICDLNFDVSVDRLPRHGHLSRAFIFIYEGERLPKVLIKLAVAKRKQWR